MPSGRIWAAFRTVLTPKQLGQRAKKPLCTSANKMTSTNSSPAKSQGEKTWSDQDAMGNFQEWSEKLRKNVRQPKWLNYWLQMRWYKSNFSMQFKIMIFSKSWVQKNEFFLVKYKIGAREATQKKLVMSHWVMCTTHFSQFFRAAGCNLDANRAELSIASHYIWCTISTLGDVHPNCILACALRHFLILLCSLPCLLWSARSIFSHAPALAFFAIWCSLKCSLCVGAPSSWSHAQQRGHSVQTSSWESALLSREMHATPRRNWHLWASEAQTSTHNLFFCLFSPRENTIFWTNGENA